MPTNNMMLFLFVHMVIISLIKCSVQNTQVGAPDRYQYSAMWSSIFNSGLKSPQMFELLQNNVKVGDPTSRALLNLFELLGIDDRPPNVASAELQVKELLESNLPLASTIYGFMIRHNLTQVKPTFIDIAMKLYTEGDPNGKSIFNSVETLNDYSITYFFNAANNGEPLAQIIIGEYYNRIGRCYDAVEMYRKAAMQALRTVKEDMISKASHGPYVEYSDGPEIHWPTINELQYLEFEADSGNSFAALQAAAILLSDEFNLPYDPLKAERYLRIALEDDISTAMVYMAMIHLDGRARTPDLTYARQLLEKALDLGDDTAHAFYAKFYLEGLDGVEKNIQLAEEHVEKGIKAGHIDSMILKAKLMASTGKNDPIHALQYYSLPAAVGHIHSAWHAAEYYMGLMSPSRTVISKKSRLPSLLLCEASLPLYRTVAQAGEWRSLMLAAYADFQENRYDSAVMKYLLLSDLGYKAAHVNLARVLQSKDVGIFPAQTDLQKHEFFAWERAANESMPAGFLEMGDHYYYGTGGLENCNVKKSIEFYKKAMSLGDAQAMFNLGYLYEEGIGVEQNLEYALECYKYSAENSEDAWMPATMAIVRFQLYQFIGQYTGYNMYSITNHLIYLIKTHSLDFVQDALHVAAIAAMLVVLTKSLVLILQWYVLGH